jgi:Ni/Fe-hydrogenase subunit HybB-like protein
MSSHAIRIEPVGGPILTRPFMILGALFTLGVVLIVWRLLMGLGAATALNDGYPWGLWITFDVVVGTALATGGYAVSILIYILNRGKYHPLVRSALLTSALGYTLGGIGVMIDLGRYWNTVKLPVFFWHWNLHSVLLEVALCIMLYTMVLWIELSPIFLEKWRESRKARFRVFATKVQPWLEKAMPWLIVLGLLLPTMHQSSLGSLMLISGHKLHPLWQTPLLPLLFLLSCIGIGYSVVVIESALASMVFRRPRETRTLGALSGAMVMVLALYMLMRVIDLAARGRLGLLLHFDRYSFLFIMEMALFALATVRLLMKEQRENLGFLFRTAMIIILAGGLYRFSTFLLAFNPGQGFTYFPALTELLITIGLVSGEIMLYIVIVKRFPILAGAKRAEPLPV